MKYNIYCREKHTYNIIFRKKYKINAQNGHEIIKLNTSMLKFFFDKGSYIVSVYKKEKGKNITILFTFLYKSIFYNKLQYFWKKKRRKKDIERNEEENGADSEINGIRKL